MLRIGICDDEQGARLALRAAVERQLERQGMVCAVFEFSSAEGLLGWLPKHPGELDLLFLDIEMGGANGMEAARTIRERDDRLALVFVTGYADYVFDGYTVGALDYLTKPPDGKRLAQVLTRVYAQIHRQEAETYTVQNVDGLYRIPMEKILYFMSDRRQVTLVTGERRYPFYAKLDEVEEQVGRGFVRTHRRYLVNVDRIAAMEGAAVVVGQESLPVSRNQRQATMLAVAEALVRWEEEL